jgi:CRP/FNR family transcriptional regulator, anaerobic regulatory protein
MKELRQYITQISPRVTALELDFIVSKFTLKTFEKDKFLLKSGRIAMDFCFVKKGCFKIFNVRDGKEMNAWFAFEYMPVTEMHSFITQKPSQYAIQAVEDTEIYAISHADLLQLYKQFNSFQYFGLKITEQILVKTIDRLTAFQFETADQRYEKIMHDPNYAQRISLKDLASFLGITPNSLSRIRHAFSKK